MNKTIAKNINTLIQYSRGWNSNIVTDELEKNQYRSHQDILDFRYELLKRILNHCYKTVPFYRKSWDNLGIKIGDIKSEEDLSLFPIITKEILNENYSDLISTVRMKYSVWKSSGSTGKPFPFILDRNTITYNTFGSLYRGKGWWGSKEGDPEAMIWSGISDVSGTMAGKLRAMRRKLSWNLKNIKLVDVYNLNEPAIIAGYNSFLKHQPILLRTISSGLYRFCLGLEHLGLDGAKLGIKGAVFTGESLPKSQRKLVENVLNCPTICEYGCCELGCMAFECPERSLHLMHDNLVFEFIKDGRPAKAGETAELVVTNLRNYAFPLIRYAVGDFVVPSNAFCKCGRTMPVIDGIQGRLHDSICTPDGTMVNGLFFTHLFDDHDEVHQFRVVQKAVDRINIELVSSEPLNTFIFTKIENIVNDKFGAKSIVKAYQVPSLPISSSGKTPWIISEVIPNESNPT